MSTHFLKLVGKEWLPYIDQLANLRMTVFREFPYLYEGDMEYEKKYLKTYASSSKSFVVLCMDGEQVVGAATCIPMQEEEESFKRPFEKYGYNTRKVMYFGESILLPQYRRRGIGQQFIMLREEYARENGFEYACFCSVIRNEKPEGYKPLDEFWNKNGFHKIPGLVAQFSWKEIGEEKESVKPLQFWIKKLENKRAENSLLTVAAAQFSLKPVASEEEFWSRLDALASRASDAGAQALLLPEFFSLSLAITRANLQASAENKATVTFQEALKKHAEENAALENSTLVQGLRKLAEKYKLTIIGGTFPATKGNRILNLCPIVPPEGKVLFQGKFKMTRFESKQWGISPVEGDLVVFELGKARCAVSICYDIEFASMSQRLHAQKIGIVFIPSCTDDAHGYWRVRHSAHARTVENQCFAVIASAFEGDPRFEEIDIHYGKSALLSPCDVGFPEQGILNESYSDSEGLCIANLDLDLLDRTRTQGTVLNFRDA